MCIHNLYAHNVHIYILHVSHCEYIVFFLLSVAGMTCNAFSRDTQPTSGISFCPITLW